jgi:glycosyltransferase involved in cell wall biosynthesis
VIRLAVVIEALGRGGAERLLVDTARLLDRKRFELRVYTLFPVRRDYAETLLGLGVPEQCLRLAGPRDAATGIGRLRACLVEHPADVVHTHLFSANLVGRLAARLGGLPVLTTYHDADYEPVVREGNPGLTPLKQLTLRILDVATVVVSRARIVAVSEYVAASVRRRLLVPRARITVVPNAVDTEVFAPDAARRAAVRAALDLTASQPVVVCVGRMTPQKGQDVLLRAFSEVLRARPESRLVLVGDGAQRREYEELAGRLGLGSAVRFLGVRADVPDILKAADVLALPSRHEGFGLVLTEALACSLPVVATRTGPVPEIVRDGETGRLFPPGDAAALAGALDGLLGDAAGRRRMGEKARADAEARFSLPVMVARLQSLYEDAVSPR